jgi:ABC-type uncharacterized transport system involved in gliding motility auxiliary subunit
MATESHPPSFSRGRKWNIAFNVTLAILVVIALAVMVNYLSGRYFKRLHLSSNARIELSPRTVSLVKSITNRVDVILYYDRDESLFSDISELLKEYRSTNPKLSVSTVDYYRDPGAALEIKAKYNLGASTNKNFVIFDCEGRSKIVDGKTLAQYTLEQVPNSTEREFRRKPVTFNGEMMFTAALFSVINPQPLKALYLTGHGEPSLTDASEAGYQTFASVLKQNYISVEPLTLTGSNAVPDDCNFLIVAGPTVPIPSFELEKIDQFLAQGGRMLALFDARTAAQAVGLEAILAKWGVRVGLDLVVDSEHMVPGKRDLVISAFTLHPVLNPIVGSGLYFVIPRPVSHETNQLEHAEVAVEEVAFTGENAFLYSDKTQQMRRRSVMVAVDGSARPAVRERGTTRMIVAGDSFFLSNHQIEILSNRDFLNSAVNWLGERNVMLQGVGPRPVQEFRLVVTQSRMQTLQWILLGAIPGGILLFGGLIWLSRRK